MNLYRSSLFGFISALAWILFVQGPAVGAESDHSHAVTVASQTSPDPSWEEKLKQQLEREDAAEGREGHRQRVDDAMQKLMDEIAKGGDHSKHAGTGPFSGMGAMQQMDRSYFLGPAAAGESVTGAGRCPKGAPVRAFDIAAINVEITLNQWLDFHPGYMYVLTENLEKVRAEEKANTEARKKEGYDPGAVTAGLQTDLIQPLNIRANQGDCVVITLQNKLDGEDVSLHIHGSSMIVKGSGQAATMANPASSVKEGKSEVFEWYVRPNEQEGAHTFHSHVGREQASLGMIGTFIVEPMG